MSKLIFCLMGPTASGKTALACELAEHFPVEIISVDSAMIYREMDIGTAKPNAEVLARAPHHLIDVLNPSERYSAAIFYQDVTKLCLAIHNRGHIPLLVGGTMMYFRAIQAGLSSLPAANEDIRASLLRDSLTYGPIYMHEWLARVDPITAARLHPNDTQRIQRALEVYQITSMPLSGFLNQEKATTSYQFVNFILIPEERAWLHKRIELRFMQMLSEGFIQEVAELIQKWHLTSEHPSMRSVGYRQVLSYLKGEDSYAALSLKGVAATRQLAKRQLTWLRHWPEAHVFSAEKSASRDQIVAIIKQILDNLH